MLCPSARVCGELGARGGSAEGTEPNGDQSRPADSGSVRDRLEGLGPRAPLLRDGEETEKQERRQVASGWVHMEKIKINSRYIIFPNVKGSTIKLLAKIIQE